MTGTLFERVDTGADFCRHRSYRLRLWRIWNAGKPPLAFIMLNPSTADESENDPTVERCERRARSWGYGGLIVGNAYALRSTDPKSLYTHPEPHIPENDAALFEIAFDAGLVILGWGTHCDKVRRGRSREIFDIIESAGKTPHALRLTKDGAPGHPLYVPYTAEPFALKPA